MSYAVWSDFANYVVNDIVVYSNTGINYICIAPNVDTIPPLNPGFWTVLPTPGGGGVDSLDGLTGAITQSCVGGTYANVGNNIELTINFPAPIVLPSGLVKAFNQFWQPVPSYPSAYYTSISVPGLTTGGQAIATLQIPDLFFSPQAETNWLIATFCQTGTLNFITEGNPSVNSYDISWMITKL